MAETTAHSEVPAGQNSFPPFQAQHYPAQLFWLTLSFALLYVLMSRIALPRIGSILEARSKRIAGDLAAAQGFKEQSDAANAAYEKALADARARAQSIANATRERQAAEAAERQKRLEAELHERLAAADRSIAATRTAAMANVRGIAATGTAAIVERLIGKAPGEQEIAKALAEVLER